LQLISVDFFLLAIADQSKWLVGSSKSKISGLMNKLLARSISIRQPPEKVDDVKDQCPGLFLKVLPGAPDRSHALLITMNLKIVFNKAIFFNAVPDESRV